MFTIPLTLEKLKEFLKHEKMKLLKIEGSNHKHIVLTKLPEQATILVGNNDYLAKLTYTAFDRNYPKVKFVVTSPKLENFKMEFTEQIIKYMDLAQILFLMNFPKS